MRIAVSSQNFRTVTGHAGKCRRFIVYDVRADGVPAEAGRLDLPLEQSFHAFAGGPHPLDGVDALLTGGAGEGLVRKLALRGVRVVVTGETDPLQAVADLAAGRVKPPALGDESHGHGHAHEHKHAHEHAHEHEHGSGGGCGCHCGAAAQGTSAEAAQ
ncbi:MAG: NifB/NifX family molybdenum-iron cluster-binding protein [Rubrivivax sp.]|nr:NifB/NifX family molybdenum-iron cluster-binding protein [Rubrivivax sp.]